MQKQYYLYIPASKRNGTLYIGITNDIIRRVGENKLKLIDGFTKKYNVALLVYYEVFNDVSEAILRKKKTKEMEWRLEDQIDRKYKS